MGTVVWLHEKDYTNAIKMKNFFTDSGFDHECVGIVRNTPESHRYYSTVLNDNKKGEGSAQSMLDSLFAWEPKEDDPKPSITINLQKHTMVMGIVTQGKKD